VSIADPARHADGRLSDEMRPLWHQRTDMRAYLQRGPRILVHAQGATLRDSAGRDYIDGLSSHNTSAVGHGRREIIDAISNQLGRLDFCALHDVSHEPALTLARRLTQVGPSGLDSVYFAPSGTEANEIAIKLARTFFRLTGQPGRTKIIGRRGSYHGNTLGAVAAGGVRSYRHTAAPLPAGFSHLPPAHTFETGAAAAEALEELTLFEGPETVAAMIAEPIAVAEGLSFPPEGYFTCLAEVCRRYGVLLIIDEVICGMGRTGSLFAIERHGVEPDLLTLGKALSGGYFPISAVLIHQRIRDAFEGRAFAHLSTYGGHPAGCAAALSVLDIIDREKLLARAEETGATILSALLPLTEQYAARRIQRRGLLIGIELASPARADLESTALDLGLVCGLRGQWIFLAPPLSISSAETDELVRRVTKLVVTLS
jgi:adenosylmethionine-8-amino-7-oxononanoate aminotransferase